MGHVNFSLFIFVILALTISGTIGYSTIEKMSAIDAFHTTIASVTFSNDASSFSSQGKLLNTALALASTGLILWAFVNFHTPANMPEKKEFSIIPPGEGIVLREILIGKKSRFAGKKKIDFLQETGTMILAIKQKQNYAPNVQFDKKLMPGMKALVMGTEKQVLSAEKAAK